MTTATYQGGAVTASAKETRKVVFAAALGTVFEWYDFFVYGSLAVIFGAMFFPKGNETAALLAALATFGRITWSADMQSSHASASTSRRATSAANICSSHS